MNEQTGGIRTVRISAYIQDNGIIRDAMTGWIIGSASYNSGSAIDYLADKIAIAAEPSDDAVELAVTIGTLAIRCGFQSDYTYRDQAAALIEADRQKVREECANEIWDRINSLFTDQDAAFWEEIEIWSKWTGPKVKAAIKGAKKE